MCNYDGSDCCNNAELIGNYHCDYVNYNHVCHFDGGDCCYEDSYRNQIVGNEICGFFHNLEMCNYDQGDCCDNSRIADGICDDTNNNRLCHYDGGDCCFGDKNTHRCSFCNCIQVYDVISRKLQTNASYLKNILDFHRFYKMSHLITSQYMMGDFLTMQPKSEG